jgi:hypothetical protein
MMVVLVCRSNYKCYWEDQVVHVLLVDGAMLTLKEAEEK